MKKNIDSMAAVLIHNDRCEIVDAVKIATDLYNAGYRKPNEGFWKQVSDKSPRYKCVICNHLFNNKEYKYCPNCGAKMKVE